MHQQIRGSPDDTGGNIRRVVEALADEGINIEAIAPDFEPPHVRVLVEHLDPYDPDNAEAPFNRALAALGNAGLTPEVRSAVLVRMANRPRALRAALDRLAREGYAVESILVLPGDDDGRARVSIGIGQAAIAGFSDAAADDLQGRIEQDIDELPS